MKTVRFAKLILSVRFWSFLILFSAALLLYHAGITSRSLIYFAFSAIPVLVTLLEQLKVMAKTESEASRYLWPCSLAILILAELFDAKLKTAFLYLIPGIALLALMIYQHFRVISPQQNPSR